MSSRMFHNSDTITENSKQKNQTNPSNMELIISFVLLPSWKIKVYTSVIFYFPLNPTQIRCKLFLHNLLISLKKEHPTKSS